MLTRTRALQLTVATWSLFILLPAATASTSPGDQVADRGSVAREASDDVPIVEHDGLVRDAAMYAATFGVSQSEALRRLSIMNESSRTLTEWSGLAGTHLAAAYYDNAESFALVIRLADDGTAAPPELVRAMKESTFPSRLEIGEGRPLDDLVSAQVGIDWESLYPDLAGTYVAPIEGTLTLNVVSPGTDQTTTVAEAIRAAPAGGGSRTYPGELSDVPVFVDFVDRPASLDNRGGRVLSTCTSGFTVHNAAGTQGMTTAGHCNNTQSYFWFSGGGPFSMSFVAQSGSGYADLQWHTTSAQPIAPLFHVSSTTARPQQGQGVGAIGQFLCHFGMTSGYDCATVQSITYQPSNTDLCGYATSCMPVYSVTYPGCISEGGDSGGPWFSGNTPHGIHSGRLPSTEQCIFSRVYYFNQLALSLLQG